MAIRGRQATTSVVRRSPSWALYLYGWARLSPRPHWWYGVPVALGGTLSMVFVTTTSADVHQTKPASRRPDDVSPTGLDG
ncbi:cytochrome ubiquinol oxidase subunit I [Micromonospora sp. NPDC005367]|uniref:cytochrome ubiquinol oxidase subunit I n=1 Tax=Micromonospora sp. NPDC005367 TaxID=3155590 RepID=UPI0033B86919